MSIQLKKSGENVNYSFLYRRSNCSLYRDPALYFGSPIIKPRLDSISSTADQRSRGNFGSNRKKDPRGENAAREGWPPLRWTVEKGDVVYRKNTILPRLCPHKNVINPPYVGSPFRQPCLTSSAIHCLCPSLLNSTFPPFYFSFISTLIKIIPPST